MGKQTVKALSEIKLAFCDLETTGLDLNEHEIIEIGLLIYNPLEDEIEKEWETKIAPSHIETASSEALKINGYINNPGAYNGNLKSALIRFNSLVKDCIMVGQNVAFDLAFLNKSMCALNIKQSFDYRSLDLVGLSWFAVKDTNIPGVSLKKLCNYFDVLNVGEHSALIDCRRAFEVYRKLKTIYKS